MGRELLSRVTTQIPHVFRKTQALSVLRPPINAGSRLSLTTAALKSLSARSKEVPPGPYSILLPDRFSAHPALCTGGVSVLIPSLEII